MEAVSCILPVLSLPAPFSSEYNYNKLLLLYPKCTVVLKDAWIWTWDHSKRTFKKTLSLTEQADLLHLSFIQLEGAIHKKKIKNYSINSDIPEFYNL